jgi:quinoprotein glucose dehydrogenase
VGPPPSSRFAASALAASLAALAAACGPGDAARSARFLEARARAAPPAREWRSYLGDPGVAHASPLARIDRTNVSRLTVAWDYDAGDLVSDGYSEIQCNPLVVKGVLYGTSPRLRLFALDAATGEELWSFRPGVPSVRSLPNPNRGLAFWEDGDDERLLYGAGPFLYALDARSGRPIPGFGDAGRIDLREGLGRRVDDPLLSASTPGAIFEDLLILGMRVSEFQGSAPGDVRAFDVRTGALRWAFHTIPLPGEPGAETWPPGARERFGGANAWSGVSVDAERGLAFFATGSPSSDYYGGERAGDNLFANSVVALDARTGERRWHFQTVRHDVWDRDLPAPPNLVTIERDGARIPAVAQVTKTGHVFVFHRETGEPLFPIEEEPVVGPGVPGEALAASQPVPLRPPPFVRQRIDEGTLGVRTPEAAAAVRQRLARLRAGALYTAPSLEGTVVYPGTDGGAEWGGAAWDARTGLLYVNANEVPWLLSIARAPAGLDPARSPRAGYVILCGGCHGADRRGDGVSIPALVGLGERIGPLDAWRVVRDGRGRMPGFRHLAWYQIAAIVGHLYTADDDEPAAPAGAPPGAGPLAYVGGGYQRWLDPDGFPATRPPWGTLTAIDLARGETAWRIPLGDYPTSLEAGLAGLGAENYGGPIVTAGGLLFIAATPDAALRAFDAATGELLWQARLPAAGFATPSTYEAGGRHFVVIAAGGGKLGQPSGSRYVAFALPE